MSIINNINQLVRDEHGRVMTLGELVMDGQGFVARESEYSLGGTRWRVERQIDANTWHGFNVRKRIYLAVREMQEGVMA